MGQQQSKLEGEIQDSRYGKATLISTSDGTFAKRKLYIQDNNQYDAFKNRIKVNHSNLVKITESGVNKESELCTSFLTMYIVSEYYPISLHKEIANRRMKSQFWNEDELFQQLTGIVGLLNAMQDVHMVHQNIRPLTISYVDSKTIKLCDNYFQQSAFQMALQNPEQQKIFELSPKLLEALHQGNQFPRHNLYKSDVWSLGMCMLEASLLDHCRDCFDYESGQVDISRKLTELHNSYSSRYSEIITKMLLFNEDFRPDFKQLFNLINGSSNIINTSLHVPDDHPVNMSMNVENQPSPQLVIDSEDSIKILQESQSSKPNKVMIEIDQTKYVSKQNLKIIQKKKKQLGFYKYQDSLVIKDNSKSRQIVSDILQPQQQTFANSSINFVSYPDYSFNQSSGIKNQDQQKINQLIGSIQKPILQPVSSSTHIITIDTHPSSKSLPQFQEIPLNFTQNTKKEFRQEMEQMIELNRSRVFKNETYPDGSQYTGETNNGMRDGFGRFQYVDSGYYEGQWRNNKMHGYGTLFYETNKKAYEGSFEMDQFSGFGTLYNKDPSILNNNFDPTNFDLIGNYWVKYVGNFRKDLKDGQGALYLSNGQCYKGEFHQDYIDGYGQFGNVCGLWKKNKLTK